MKKTLYYLVDAGLNPDTNKTWYDILKGTISEVILEAKRKNYNTKNIIHISTSFRKSIGILLYDKEFQINEIKPLYLKLKLKK